MNKLFFVKIQPIYKENLFENACHMNDQKVRLFQRL